MKKVCVLGSGSFGTSLATLLTYQKCEVSLWCFEDDVVDDIISTRMNKNYLPAIHLDSAIKPTSSIFEAVEGCEVVFVAVPVRHIRLTLAPLAGKSSLPSHWISLSKGIEQKTHLLPTEIIEDVLGSSFTFSALSGPTFARELALHAPSAAMLASTDKNKAHDIISLLSNSYFHLFYSDDVKGVQLCGALKNILALLMGVAQGEDCSFNTTALFFTQGIKEISLVIETLGGNKETALSLAGIGDAVLTAFGTLGRNQKAGMMIGEGSTLAEVIDLLGHEPEGINTVRSVYEIIKKKEITVPVLEGAYEIIFKNRSLRSIIPTLFHL